MDSKFLCYSHTMKAFILTLFPSSVHTGESKEDHRKRVEKEGPERMREAIAYADEIPGLESDDDEDEEMEEGEEEHGGELDHYLEDPSDDDEGQQTVGNPVGGVLIPAF